MIEAPPVDPREQPHPVDFDVAYPERLSRWKIFVKLIFAIPQFIVVYLLFLVAYILTLLAWFAVLFTGRYPKAFFEFCAGTMRWAANLTAYVLLLRDEYPPFSWEPGEYPLRLDIPRAERQSRFRLFIRIFAAVPSYIALQFLQIAVFFTTFIAWWAILFTGRYPSGLFKFSVGMQRWNWRLYAYALLLRDEYPPYSLRRDARPGNEVVSTIVGVPLLAAYFALTFAPIFAGGGGAETTVSLASIEAGRPAELHAGSLRLELVEYHSAAGRSEDGLGLIAFTVHAKKDGFWPTMYTPHFFTIDTLCAPGEEFEFETSYGAYEVRGDQFEFFWVGGDADSSILFEVFEGEEPCMLEYFTFGGTMRFNFTP